MESINVFEYGSGSMCNRNDSVSSTTSTSSVGLKLRYRTPEEIENIKKECYERVVNLKQRPTDVCRVLGISKTALYKYIKKNDTEEDKEIQYFNNKIALAKLEKQIRNLMVLRSEKKQALEAYEHHQVDVNTAYEPQEHAETAEEVRELTLLTLKDFEEEIDLSEVYEPKKVAKRGRKKCV